MPTVRRSPRPSKSKMMQDAKLQSDIAREADRETTIVKKQSITLPKFKFMEKPLDPQES